jgi:hypothetical protein
MPAVQIDAPGHWLSRWHPGMHTPCGEQIFPEPFVPGLHAPSEVHSGGVVVPPPVVAALHWPAVQVWPVGQS